MCELVTDKRRKLSEADKQDILDNRAGLSIHALAQAYGVSRRTVQFILYPERLEENLQRRKERGGWRQYYDKTKHAEYIRVHRRYKKGN